MKNVIYAAKNFEQLAALLVKVWGLTEGLRRAQHLGGLNKHVVRLIQAIRNGVAWV